MHKEFSEEIEILKIKVEEIQFDNAELQSDLSTANSELDYLKTQYGSNHDKLLKLQSELERAQVKDRVANENRLKKDIELSE